MISSEPFLIPAEDRHRSGRPVAPRCTLGQPNIITTSAKLGQEKPDLVQRFVDASIEGWYLDLYGDPTPANRLITQAMGRCCRPGRFWSQHDDRPWHRSRRYQEPGHRCHDARWRSLSDDGELGVYKPNIEVAKAYTTRFVNKRVGMDAGR